jgi:hypothetical protein
MNAFGTLTGSYAQPEPMLQWLGRNYKKFFLGEGEKGIAIGGSIAKKIPTKNTFQNFFLMKF